MKHTIIEGLRSNFVECECFLESYSLDILALCETNLDDSIDSDNVSVKGCLPLMRKDSITHMHSFAVYVKEGLHFARDLYLENSITSQKVGSRHFWLIGNSDLNKGKSAISAPFNDPEVLSSESDIAKVFADNFSKNSNLDDSGISLPFFPSRTNLKLCNISITPKIVKKVITNLIHQRHLVLIVFQWWF